MLSGVITRMPLVCMSIVASALKYGWAPTLIPLTTTLISPPACVKLHDPPQRRRDPVHVLGAGVHRDLRARGEREPLARHVELLGEVERGDDPPALGLGQRAERPGRVAEQHDAQHPLGVALGAVADQPDHDARAGSSPPGARRGRARRPRRGRARRTRRRGITAPGAARWGARTLTISAGCSVPRRRAETIRWAPSSSGCSGCVGGSPTSTTTPLARRVEDAQRAVALDAVHEHARAEHHQLEAQADGLAGEAGDDRARLLRPEVDRRARRRAAGGSTAAAGAPGGATGPSASPRTPGAPCARAPAAR